MTFVILYRLRNSRVLILGCTGAAHEVSMIFCREFG